MRKGTRTTSKLISIAGSGFVILCIATFMLASELAHGSVNHVPAQVVQPNIMLHKPVSVASMDSKMIACSTASCLSSALKKVVPGSSIVLAPGTYKGSFSSDVNGTAGEPITIRSQDPAHPAVLSGHSTGSGYSLRIRGDYWVIRDLQMTNAQKGIVLDHSDYTLISDVEVYNIGYEGVHFRDGSSYGTIQNSRIHHTGRTSPGYGEGVYVGSAEGGGYNQATHYNTVRNVIFGPHVTAEHIDIKERTIGTLVENCTFYGEGISGDNYADSFIDIKGNNAIIRGNVGYQSNNSNIVDAFQLHEIVAGWGVGGSVTHNTLYLDNPAVFLLAGYSNTSAFASQNTRSPAGSMYKGNIIVN
ncbi:right-handed parallel beta-helix repeat-containing protein [Paenibacillus sp. UMB4589-SE434]|uniref:right-handed parallel beta-helix repeat-containing protein n=1 Tax=Paenibacillus sp. UMB4589-SE434 TaxID=3046314 RepID=UPI00254A3B91|nr:right-handed parallel beta-helix repeat-containing protein [Paenibacillus sp. UMB4589-SE434]MDK8179853.1 sheath polysaccharide-degrading enzyme [Paenibacillus sp. UMB4589-SE434]